MSSDSFSDDDTDNPRVCLVDEMWRAEIFPSGDAEAMTEQQFDLLLSGILERPVASMTARELIDRISVVQAATDRLFLEIEQRDLLPCSGDDVLIPYIVPPSRHLGTALIRSRSYRSERGK